MHDVTGVADISRIGDITRRHARTRPDRVAIHFEGRRVTSYPTIADDCRNAGANWEDAEVVVDGNMISSRRPDDLPAFMAALLEVAVSEPVPAGELS